MTQLFSPMTLRGLTVRNRVWLPPMCQYSCENRDGVPGQWHLTHLGARAAGGFGLIITEASAVVPEGRISPQDAGIWNDEQTQAWTPIVDFAHAQGAAIGIQLAHAGRKASTHRPFPGEGKGTVSKEAGGWPTLGPSDLAYPGLAEPSAMSAEQIRDVVKAFGAAAERAVEAGFDTVEIHAAHGYLIHSFLSPLSNDRDDEYGSGTGRWKLLRDILAAVRARVPEDFPVLVRISADEWAEGGFGIDEAVELSRVLHEEGCDLVDVSGGGNTPADIPVGPGYQTGFAQRIREAGVPTAAVGLITDPVQAQTILTTGQADAVLIGRAALREPSWPLRAAHELGLNPREIPYPPQYVRGRW